jgi:hypothetical protein
MLKSRRANDFQLSALIPDTDLSNNDTTMSSFSIQLREVPSRQRRDLPSPTMAGAPSPFSVLPPDIVMCILKTYLAPRDVLAVACVCRASRAVATSDVCWRSFLPEGLLGPLPHRTGAFAEARALFEVHHDAEEGATRNLPDGSRVAFLGPGDIRGTVRVSCCPGNEGGVWIDDTRYWERQSESSAPGRDMLILKHVWWLDVFSGFHVLPAGSYTLSTFILFDGISRGYMSEGILNCKLEVLFERLDGTVRDSRDCGRVFQTLPLNQTLRNQWLRIDLLDCQVLAGDGKLRLRLHNTDTTYKSGMCLARCDAVPETRPTISMPTKIRVVLVNAQGENEVVRYV